MISKLCGLGGRLFKHIMLLMPASALFVPASLLLVFREKLVRFTSDSKCNGNNYLDPSSERYFLS